MESIPGDSSEAVGDPQGDAGNWVAASKASTCPSAPGARSAVELAAENTRLRKELAEARMERDILIKRPRTLPGSPLRTQYMKQKHILLVDDDEQVLSITKLFLEYEGYRNLHVIQDSRLVIPFLRENTVSMIVIDLMMPHIMGNELLYTLRDEFPKIPVIIMTATGDMDIAEECKKLGALDFLVKPVDPETSIVCYRKSNEKIISFDSRRMFF